MDHLVGKRRDWEYGTGAAYLVFGQTTGHSPEFELDSLDGSNGYVILGANEGDQLGRSGVSLAGDINGDGSNDVIVAAHRAGETNANGYETGEIYVIFGTTNSQDHFASLDAADGNSDGEIDVAHLDGTHGFAIRAADAGGFAGFSLSSAGDVNGDLIDDLIIGTRLADSNGNQAAGGAYVLFGSSNGFSAVFDLASLGSSDGFAIHGVAPSDQAGLAVASGFDLNADGYGDLAIGAPYADPGGRIDAGTVYAVFGGPSVGTNGPLELASLLPQNGGDGSTRIRDQWCCSKGLRLCA